MILLWSSRQSLLDPSILSVMILSYYGKEMTKSHTLQLQTFVDKYFNKSEKKSFKFSQMQKIFVNNFHQLIMNAHFAYFNDKTITDNVPYQPCKNMNGIPEEFRQTITENLGPHRVFAFKCGNRNIRTTFYAEKCKTYALDNYIKHVYIWLHIACQFAPKSCALTIHIHIFLTNLTKKRPSSQTIPFNQTHANTAFTHSCVANPEIVIYRLEEWFKVFIHETFHTLGLDFSTLNHMDAANQQINKIFNLRPNNRDYRLYESYTETWADIIHVCMVVHFNLIQQKHFEYSYVENVESLLRQEITFSMIQCTKVLHHNHLKYIQLLNGQDNTYRENTNIMSYYIVRCILLFHANEFIYWTMMQNHHSIEFKKNEQNVLKYVGFIEKCSRDQSFINSMMQIEEQYKLMESRDKTSYGATTMRMTMIE